MARDQYSLTRDLFFIPDIHDADKAILYAPLKGKLLHVNSGAARLIETVSLDRLALSYPAFFSTLVSEQIVEKETSPAPDARPRVRFFPLSVTIFPTTDCNLRCLYCYGSGGHSPTYIDEEVANAAVDLVLNNCLDRKNAGEPVLARIGFHGGGEPLLEDHGNWAKVTRIVDRARSFGKQHAVGVRIATGTNGVLSDAQRRWIVSQVDTCTVSMDGPADIHNACRPKAKSRYAASNRSDSCHAEVAKTISCLVENRRSFFVRSTISQASVGKMVELVDYLHSLGVINIHFEPLSVCGRGLSTNQHPPTQEDFLAGIVASRKRAAELGMELRYSGGRLSGIVSRFCGAAGQNFCVTQDGYVSSCYEVMRQGDPRIGEFFYGRFNKATKAFDIDYERLQHLDRRTVDGLPGCRTCCAKYTCAGDCLAKVATTSSTIFDTTKAPNCAINRKLVILHVNSIIHSAQPN